MRSSSSGRSDTVTRSSMRQGASSSQLLMTARPLDVAGQHSAAILDEEGRQPTGCAADLHRSRPNSSPRKEVVVVGGSA
jgi:hypothetical protein